MGLKTEQAETKFLDLAKFALPISPASQEQTSCDQRNADQQTNCYWLAKENHSQN
jgi:hypothetical protein